MNDAEWFVLLLDGYRKHLVHAGKRAVVDYNRIRQIAIEVHYTRAVAGPLQFGREWANGRLRNVDVLRGWLSRCLECDGDVMFAGDVGVQEIGVLRLTVNHKAFNRRTGAHNGEVERGSAIANAADGFGAGKTIGHTRVELDAFGRKRDAGSDFERHGSHSASRQQIVLRRSSSTTKAVESRPPV